MTKRWDGLDEHHGLKTRAFGLFALCGLGVIFIVLLACRRKCRILAL